MGGGTKSSQTYAHQIHRSLRKSKACLLGSSWLINNSAAGRGCVPFSGHAVMSPGTKSGTSSGAGSWRSRAPLRLSDMTRGSAPVALHAPFLQGAGLGQLSCLDPLSSPCPMPWGKGLDVLLLARALLTSSSPPRGKRGHVPPRWC